ncbi:MAG: DUF3343 domain-containing protein [Deltaproteobacteria bacterium]|nr:DUF3343 domain-containing protein [Deltaproteobacteria bacterium]
MRVTAVTLHVSRFTAVIANSPEICYFPIMEYLLTFGSAHAALKAESVLKEAGLKFKLLPAPKPLSALCDLVILAGDNIESALDTLKAKRIKPKAVYKRTGDDYERL